MTYEERATVYSIYRFDCPACGAVVDIGDVDPPDETECDDCGEVIGLDS